MRLEGILFSEVIDYFDKSVPTEYFLFLSLGSGLLFTLCRTSWPSCEGIGTCVTSLQQRCNKWTNRGLSNHRVFVKVKEWVFTTLCTGDPRSPLWESFYSTSKGRKRQVESHEVTESREPSQAFIDLEAHQMHVDPEPGIQGWDKESF